MDKIQIKGLRVFAFHGVKEEEKRKGQPFVLDIVYEGDFRKACGSDRLEDTVNYSSVVKTALQVMQKPSELIENAAQRLADALLESYPPIEAVTVTLKKPRAPIAADFDYVAVEIRRERGKKA